MTFLFVLRTSPDIDHMAPVMWKLLEEGEKVHAVVPHGYDADADYRLRFLGGQARFQLHRVGRPRGRLASYLHDNIASAVIWLLRHRVGVVVTEWGSGLPHGVGAHGTRAWAHALWCEAKRYAVGRRTPDPFYTRHDFIVAAAILGRRTACLPHGLNVKLDAIATKEAEILHERPHPWHDRNRFDVYVFNTEHHRRWHIDYAVGDPDVMQTWGSARWDPVWFELNRTLAPSYEWPAEGANKLKVVFMVPKWEKRVDAAAVVKLVRELQSLDFVSLAVKEHPRPKDGSAEPLKADPGIDWDRLHDVARVDSVPLIAAADVVIDVGSSIGIEVVMQGKVLVNARHLHGLTTFFDVVQGSCVVATSAGEVAEYLRAHRSGERHQVEPGVYEELLRSSVYGSRSEPFDVLDLYYRRLTGLRRRRGGTTDSVTAAIPARR